MAMRKSHEKEKAVDLPPTGDRNADPITGEAGAHPIETGVGAAAGGVAVGAAVGTVAGPVGTAVGAAIGAVAGGLIGSGVGEWIDPTVEDEWLRQTFPDRGYAEGATYETYEPAYDYAREADARSEGRLYQDVEGDLKSGWEKTEHAASLPWSKAKPAVRDVYDYRHARRYGGEAGDRYAGKSFAEVEADLKSGWGKTKHAAGMTWDRAKDVVRGAYDQTIKLREERLKVSKRPVKAGEVDVRKEIVTEDKTITVPVEREEVVIERRPGSGRAVAGDVGDTGREEMRIPVRAEEVDVTTETVEAGEVDVRKRKVHDTEKAGATLRKEELKVDERGDVKVKDGRGKGASHR